MVFTFYHQIYVMYNLAICKGFLQIFSFPILNIIWNRFMVRRSQKNIRHFKHRNTQRACFQRHSRSSLWVAIVCASLSFRSWQREIVIWGDGLVWFSIVFSINFSSFFHQSQLFCGGNSMGCDPEEPSTEYPSGGLLPNCSSNPFLLVIPHPRYGPKNL